MRIVVQVIQSVKATCSISEPSTASRRLFLDTPAGEAPGPAVACAQGPDLRHFDNLDAADSCQRFHNPGKWFHGLSLIFINANMDIYIGAVKRFLEFYFKPPIL